MFQIILVFLQSKTKNGMYQVTIGIPLYRAVDYVGATLSSALEQTFESIEFLVVDDYGGDGSLEVVERLAQTHPRGKHIRILKNDRNLSVSETRNRIIDEAKGRYLYFLDSDDLIEPDTIELLMDAVQRTDANVAYASYERIDNVNHTPTQQFLYPSLVLSQPDAFATYVFRHYGTFQVSVCNCLFDLSFLRETKLRFIDAIFWEDMAFSYEFAPRVKHAILVPNLTYHYHCRPNSLSNFQDRPEISKEEVLKNISTIDYLKGVCFRLQDKPYIPYMCYNLGMNSFYIVCHILKQGRRIVPSFTNEELRQSMHVPFSLAQVLRFRRKRVVNLVLWLLSKLPLPLFMSAVRLLGRKKGVL